MIEKYYASKRPKPKSYYPVTHHVTQQFPFPASNVGAPSAFETARAEKMGLTVEVYRHRVTEVSRAQSACPFQVGDTVWPAAEKDIDTYGMCQVIGVCRHYNDYGTVDWNDPPFILSVQSMKDRTEMLNTTANWVIKHRPVFITEDCGEC
jgi:hypothetical protein